MPLLALFAAGFLCCSGVARATQTYCVGTTAEFQAALDQAENDNDDSRIDVRAGTYNLSSDLRYEPQLEGIIVTGKLTIEGGYGAGCASQSYDAADTTLQSDGSRNLRIVTRAGGVVIKSIGFSSASLKVRDEPFDESCFSNDLTFEFRRVRIDGGALWVSSAICHDVIVRDSLFINGASNESGIPAGTSLQIWPRTAADIDHAATATLINTTVAEGRFNLATCCDRRATAFVYNSVFRRAGTEIFAEATNVFAVSSRFDPIAFSASAELGAGSLLAGSGDNTAVNPDLDSSYRPNPGSPMLDAGTSVVPNGLSTLDVTGGPRIIGSDVDRGAVESPVDGSGVYTVTNTSASGAGSLADAVAQANLDPGYNTIKFNIGGACPHRIVLAAGLSLQGSTLIDGWSQSGNVKNSDDIGWNAAPCILLDGNDVVGTAIVTASQLGTGNLQVRGLAFERFSTAILLAFGRNHLIFGNQFAGKVGATGPTLAGNDIAITVAGAVTGTVVGGTDEPNRNLIGSSATAGVQIIGASATANQVVNNLIGVDKNAVFALPNLDGVYISAHGNSMFGNRVANNTRDGVVLTSANAYANSITQNSLGGSVVSGPFTLSGNGRMGVLIDNDAHDNTIGPDNIIGNNGDSGVRVLSAAGGRNAIIANRINLNGAPGIDLGANGVTANSLDPTICDITLGCAANRGQNFPVIDNAIRVSAGDLVGISIGAHLVTTYSASPYRIDFYRSRDCNASGYGEGSHWIGSKNVVVSNSGICASGNCNKDFSYGTLNDPDVVAGDAISATATSPSGDTSEFAACVLIEDAVTDRIFQDSFD
jgi:hypothetical protein